MTIMRLFAALLMASASTAFAQEKLPAVPAEPIPVFHPMDALTKEEIEATAKILKDSGKTSDKVLFAMITLLEPPKDQVRAWTLDSPQPSRMALAVLRQDGKTYEARVDLAAAIVKDFKEQPGVHPIILDVNWARARDAFMADPRFLAALEKRGLKKDDNILCTPNSAGWLPGEDHSGKSLLKVPCFSQVNKLHPSMARPIEGLMGVVDSESGEVLQVFDRQVVELPPAPAGYGADLPKLKPLAARVGISVEGLGNLKLTGNVNAEWLNWRFHVRPDKRAGVVMSLVQFNDDKSWRDMAYQMNVSEIFVPYMDPDPTWAYRTFIDAGEFGLGYLLSSLQPGVDCPDTAAFVDLTFPNDTGGSYLRQRGLCIFERPTGDPAWRHYSAGNQYVDGEPQLELVVRHIPTLGNYDYIVDYVFTPQGNIKLRVGATGFDAIKSVPAKDMESPTAKEDTIFGNLIAPYTLAPFHDHFFSFRLDLDVDGPQNTLVRNTFALTTPKEGPRKSMWVPKAQRYVKEGPVSEDHSSAAGKLLRLTNPKKTNALKQNTSMWLDSGHSSESILTPDDPAQARAQFSSHEFWVTRYKPDELWAAGPYPNLNPRDEGLPQYVADSEDVLNQDIVMWYTLGFRHLTRPEDFPILPTYWHEMTIRPAFFFDMDPAMTFNSGYRQ